MSLLKEETNMREASVLAELPGRGKLKVTGTDRISFLNNILTNDIKNLVPGQGCHAALLTATGKILLWMKVLVFQDFVLLDLEPGMEEKAVPLLDRYLITEDVQIAPIETSKHFALIGKQSARTEGSLVSAKNPEKGLFYKEFSAEGVKGALLKFRLRTEIFHEIIIFEGTEKAGEEILKIGKSTGLIQGSAEVYEIFRIENGIPAAGKEITEEILLPETGLEQDLASETKGCYPGQEVVARIATYKSLKRKLVCFHTDSKEGFQAGDKIFGETGEAQKEIGWVTSAVYSPGLKKNLALGYLDKAACEANFKVHIANAEKLVDAKVSTFEVTN